MLAAVVRFRFASLGGFHLTCFLAFGRAKAKWRVLELLGRVLCVGVGVKVFVLLTAWDCICFLSYSHHMTHREREKREMA